MDTTALLRHTSRFPVFQNGNLGDLACLDIYYKELQEKRGAQNIVFTSCGQHWYKHPFVQLESTVQQTLGVFIVVFCFESGSVFFFFFGFGGKGL